MTKVNYNVLGAALFVFGLSLLIQLPGSRGTFGSYLFNGTAIDTILSERNIPYIPILAAAIQAAGILMFSIWMKEERQEYYRIYRKFEILFIGILLLGASPLVNHTIAAAAKTYSFSGKSGVYAVEYVKDKSSCQYDEDNYTILCNVVLKNYQHMPQKLEVGVPREIEGTPNMAIRTPVHLPARQERVVSLALSTNDLDKEQSERLLKGKAPDIAFIRLAE
ncbi:hypothetical protein [Bacillus massilinigeriensis]|uniref:hypothetical protein n=1 Tax=Bacillus mediterraneensis TaxID=1805474 RepID=UPI0008F94ED1|nr:hypothetical protein [Bacillus mediterraneensis]